ncbi:cytochrome P450 6k1-like [Ischnura elegans]|uniref:cytochrome P450 6k1-like n=1 Tax=Ischnura elegans TaxID=197161 RepID=UPI001ED8BDD4|nr:cytochrome P450 6k1-like [Ischnura elegans]XP_046382742.1 cytochrome P450 6k1-like [Ischnura elegans]XP_046382743.1 cytochrome P450 6k1-like [Ischnura elegans]XP_046382744.1 cytochrome P450 6k1-like [Ischnura elegans]
MVLTELVVTGLSVSVAIFVGLVTVAIVFLKWRFGYWRRAGVPYIEPTIPFGNLKDSFLGRRHAGYVFEDIHNKIGDKPFGGIYMFYKPTIVLKEPKLIRDCLVKNFATHFNHRVASGHEKLDPMLYKNMFMTRGERWKSLRTGISPTFTSGKMKMMYHLVQEKAEVLADQIDVSIKNGAPTIDVKELLALYTTDVISSCAFGIETDSLRDPQNEFRQMGKRLFLLDFKHMLNTLIIFLFPSFVKITGAVFIEPDVAAFFRKVVWDVVSERESKGILRGDFIDLLIQLKNTGRIQETDAKENAQQNGFAQKNGSAGDAKKSSKPSENSLKNFDGDEFVSQVVLFFGAGFETSSTTGSFALFELAANPKVQDRLTEEIDTTLEKYGGKFSYEAVQGMRYLDMVINETLRKYPPLAVLDRECVRDYHNEEYNLHVPNGMAVMISLFGLHKDPRYFPDPETFNPDRFSEENFKKIPNYVYMPFGEGPRNCVGMRFGVMQTKVGLVNILSRFRVELPDHMKGVKTVPIDPRIFVLGVKDGIPLVITRRKKH